MTLSNERDVHLYPELKRKLFAAASDGSNGELSIAIPPEIGIETLKGRKQQEDAEKRTLADQQKGKAGSGALARDRSPNAAQLDGLETRKETGSSTEDSTPHDADGSQMEASSRPNDVQDLAEAPVVGQVNAENKAEGDANAPEAAAKEKEEDQEDEEEEVADEYLPLTIRIYYKLNQPLNGLQFVKPTTEAPHRVPHIYTTPSCADWARCWTPCLDSLWERCTWQLDFVVPKFLALGTAAEANVDEDGADEVLVVCSGDLVERTTHPHNPDKVIFSYLHASPTSVQHIAFAAGPFSMHTIAKQPSSKKPGGGANDTSANLAESAGPQVMGFCLPGREEEMVHSIGFTRQALDFFARDYGSFPFGSFKMVFVDEPLVDCHIGSTLSICSSDILHPSNIVDQAYETHHILSHAIAFQWVGINIIQRSWSDTWLIHGISLHMTSLFLRRIWGNNEYRFRLKKDIDRLVAWDIAMPPLFQPGMTEPPDSGFLPFLNLKAPLVLFILDRRLSKVGASFGLSRALNKIFLDALTGELQNNVFSTSQFLRQCRKLGGVDLSTFSDQWIYGSGCPHIFLTAVFNRKKLLIEMNIRQECPAATFAVNNPNDAVYSNPIERFEGQITVRIHEADGTPYEHVIDIDSLDKRIDVPFNTKYKRIRRNTKRFQARKEAAAAAAQGDEEAREAMGLIDLGFVFREWEDEAEREAWRVADWTEQEEADMNSAPYEWIRVDPEMEWLATIHFQQESWMWISQLERDRDIVAQVGAVQALSSAPSPLVSSMLTRTVLVDKYFFRVRTEAAQGLVNCATPALDQIGLFHLLKLFQTRYCHAQPPDYEADGPLDMLLVPRANDFSDLSEYFLRRAIIQAVSRVRDEHGQAPALVKRFLINVLRYNDNSANKYSDEFYIASLITAIAFVLIPADNNAASQPTSQELEENALLLQAAVDEVERCRELDMLVPSFHNIISIAALDFHAATMMANMKPVDYLIFFAYTRQGNYAPLRIAAFNGLVLMRGLQHKIIARYLFAVLRSDESSVVKRALARAILESLAVAIACNEFGELKPRSSLYLEGDPAAAYQAETTRERDLENVLRSLRKEVGRSAAIREGFMAALLSQSVDSEARWALLKLAELLFKPAAESDLPFLPKVSVRMRMPSLAFAASSDTLTPGQELPKLKLVRTSTDPSSGECRMHRISLLAPYLT